MQYLLEYRSISLYFYIWGGKMNNSIIKACFDALTNIRSVKWQRHMLETAFVGIAGILAVEAYIFEKDASEEFDKENTKEANKEIDCIFDSSTLIEDTENDQMSTNILEG